VLPRLNRNAFFFLAVLSSAPPAQADYPTLPYTERVHGYSAWSPWVLGDTRSIGMADATVGLGDSWASLQENPAGTAMTLPTLSVQFNHSTIPDGNQQSYDQPVQVSDFGAVINPYPWGFGIGYSSPHSERQTSFLNDGSALATTDLSIKDVTFSASRLAFHDRLSIGVLVDVSTAKRSFSLPSQTWDASETDLKMTLGLLYQLEKRVFLGLRWTPATSYGVPTDAANPPAIPGFLTQPTYSPWILGMGVGWIPNVNFRSGFSALLVGRTPQAALVSDQNRIVGEKMTVQPRIGIDYRWIDLSWLEGRLSAGSYYEMSRIADTNSRVHGTIGFEINPSIFNLGVALDRAPGYVNSTAGIGVDMVRIARVLEIIPKDSSRRYAGFFTSPAEYRDENLPRPINPHWDPSQTATPGAIVDIASQIPRRIEEKFTGTSPKAEPSSTPSTSPQKPSVRPAKKTIAAPSGTEFK